MAKLLVCSCNAVALTVVLIGCTNNMEKTKSELKTAPVAEKHEHAETYHGIEFKDNYFWLRNRDDAKMLAYLKEENAFTDAYFSKNKQDYNRLLSEIKGRVLKDDESVPYFDNGYYYVSKYEGDNEHAIYYRTETKNGEAKQMLLDINVLAKGKPFCEEGVLEVSPDNHILAYTIDYVGRRKYELHFTDIASGKPLADVIMNTAGTVVWANDNKTVFYTLEDEETLRSYKIMRHVLGTDSKTDVCIFEEKDETYSVDVNRSKSGNFILIQTISTNTTECWYLNANKPFENLTLFQPRHEKVEYTVDEINNIFYVRTNLDAPDFKICKALPGKTNMQHWQDVVPYSAGHLVENFELFANYLVTEVRIKGLVKLMVLSTKAGEPKKEVQFIEAPEEDYVMSFSVNEDPHSNTLRYYYGSLKTPICEFDYDLAEKKQTLLKQNKLNVPYNSAEYTTQRVYAKAADGKEIPISVVYKTALYEKGKNPCLVYGYGSYGVIIDPYFSASRLSLLDRGFVFCIAHIRGGEDLGRAWYDEGRLLHKKNTFTDFITCTEYMINTGFANHEKIFAQGGSAGGLLMGAVVNMRPDLYKGIIADVPFVDVINTMMDKTIPLTTGEYDEWGNPNQKEFFDYMLSYSPYDNVKSAAYPAMFIITGLHDSQVQYWEPAKWVAKLRVFNTGQNPILLHTNMHAGHGGSSGRFEGLKEIAMKYTFLIANL